MPVLNVIDIISIISYYPCPHMNYISGGHSSQCKSTCACASIPVASEPTGVGPATLVDKCYMS